MVSLNSQLPYRQHRVNAMEVILDRYEKGRKFATGGLGVLYKGKDLVTGFAAFGSTPGEAASNFDYEWVETLAEKKEREEAAT